VRTEKTFSITNKTTRAVPRAPFVEIKNKVLGEKYELSLVFVGKSISHKLNLQYRDKDKPTNVLSFPLSKTSGEIFIDLSFKEHSPIFLFIHGLLHLKGMQHGATMEREEKKLLAHVQTLRNRN
jgi:ssRNA-specific RNase YbeY (16S rRNA maturation enzyme)